MAPQLGMMEAMNALVIMDPRMDTGCRSPLKDGQEAAKQGMEDSLVDVCELVYDVESICAIMDRILELEVSWSFDMNRASLRVPVVIIISYR